MKSKEETKIYLETNENKNTTIPNLWDTGKAALRGEFTALQAYLKKTRRNSKDLTLHLQKLEKNNK